MAILLNGRFRSFENLIIMVPIAIPPQNDNYAFATEEGDILVSDDNTTFIAEEA